MLHWGLVEMMCQNRIKLTDIFGTEFFDRMDRRVSTIVSIGELVRESLKQDTKYFHRNSMVNCIY